MPPPGLEVLKNGLWKGVQDNPKKGGVQERP